MLASDEERVCLDARPHGVVLARPLGQALALAAAGGVLLALPWPSQVPGALLVIAGALLALRSVWLWERTHLVVTTEKLFVVSGTLRAPRLRGPPPRRSRTSSWSRAFRAACSATAPWSPARSRSSTFRSRGTSTASSSGSRADGGRAARGSRPHEALRLDDGGRRPHLRDRAGPHHGVLGPERRRQDDDAADAPRARARRLPATRSSRACRTAGSAIPRARSERSWRPRATTRRGAGATTCACSRPRPGSLGPGSTRRCGRSSSRRAAGARSGPTRSACASD